ncbi:uncharacterized protein MONBRDRAFT_34179 [Monosiga brevicollis MX1]|uniref:Amino acid transporter transmembrane domain-containing protein n=1 Tax=Monosiga brevicollis TaxID=81824 RepID=A9VA18_MONBE|nr:uncharacterized protein MONBRDRAFT_34179 [Monosiga brevicollis MX1]EDQ85587.1 predicted protein [Monosiga brevicollis MX1]|eukprot:XP_001749536.1 hypothetical protein [Monosiga brevicollis MX1]
MAGGGPDDGSTYAPLVAAVYVFNLIVGAGALAMPKAFGESGYLGGSILIAILAFTSYVTVTYMIEAMAMANCLMRTLKKNASSRNNGLSIEGLSDETPLINESVTPTERANSADVAHFGDYAITERAEMGSMAQHFFPPIGVKLFYFCIIVYLYGDLCIYAVAVPKSLQSVTCPSHNSTMINGTHVHHHETCLGDLNSTGSYRIYLLLFACLLGPFAFFNAQKTKWIQLMTTLLRWTTFMMMIIIAIMGLAGTQTFNPPIETPSPASVKVATVEGLPGLFGVAIYSFMCHHSLPSMITPMTTKRNVNGVLISDFALILGFYCLLCFTAVFRFPGGTLEDLYTLNFKHFQSSFVSYFLGLFPVFTLSANFPIIAITLRNNLALLLAKPNGQPRSPIIERVAYPLLAILPPFVVAFFTENVEFLVGITGSYAGVGIQYVIPACLVLFGRRRLERELRERRNPHRSVFGGKIWIYGVLVWSVLCIALVTFNHIYEGKTPDPDFVVSLLLCHKSRINCKLLCYELSCHNIYIFLLRAQLHQFFQKVGSTKHFLHYDIKPRSKAPIPRCSITPAPALALRRDPCHSENNIKAKC